MATIRDLGSLPQGQATQNPVATKASIPWNCFTFRGMERLASVLHSSTWWRLHNVVSYAIVASRQSKSLSRGLCPYPPNRGAHYRYTLKMRLPDTCNLSPLRQVYVVRLSRTDGKRNHTHYRYADPRNGSLLFVATIRDLGSLPQGQATQNPVATKASIPWNCFTFRGMERLASVLHSSTWWRLHSINTCRESRKLTKQRGRTKTHFCASPPCRVQINAELRALRP